MAKRPFIVRYLIGDTTNPGEFHVSAENEIEAASILLKNLRQYRKVTVVGVIDRLKASSHRSGKRQ